MRDQIPLSASSRFLILFALAIGSGCPGDDIPVVTSDSSSGDSSTTATTLPTGPTTTPPDSSSTSADTTMGDTTMGDTTMGSSDTGPVPGCGDDVIDDGEECEGADLGGQDCVSQGYLGGDLACGDDCLFDASACNNCGDDAIDGDDVCDGTDLAAEDCVSQGYDAGTLGCEADCSAFNVDECIIFSCGNDILEGMEACDGTDLAGQDCTTLPVPFDGGVLGCNARCTDFDTTGCYVCGDDVTNGMEVCDGADLGGETCATQGFDGGTLGCALDCGGYDTSGCFSCGDGVLNGAEACDGADLGGETCVSQGFMFGNLACDPACNLDLAGCSNAPTYCSTPGSPIGPGAGVITTDTIAVPALGGFITDVNVTVDANHTWVGDLEIDIRHVESDTSVRLADNICGSTDDINASFDQDAAAAPDCVAPIAIEGDVLPLQSLEAFTGIGDVATTWEIEFLDTAGGDGGTLNEWCVVFETGADPNVCGDGVVTFTEQCEGADLGGGTCASLGYLAGGTLGCTAGCTYDTAACDASEGVCGNNVINNNGVAPDESCDNNELASTRCEDLGFVGGSLDCSFPTCGFDTSECSNSVIAVCSTPGIPYSNVAPALDTINLADLGNVGDLDVFVDTTHTWTGDIDMSLINVDTGTQVNLVFDDCGSANDVQAFFNDEGNGPANCVAPIAIEGNLTPEQPLSGFDGLPIAGDWQLQIVDDTGGDNGTLNEWCLYFTPQ